MVLLCAFQARRSMRFSEKLVQIATHHRAAYPTHPVSAADTLAENDEEVGTSDACSSIEQFPYVEWTVFVLC